MEIDVFCVNFQMTTIWSLGRLTTEEVNTAIEHLHLPTRLLCFNLCRSEDDKPIVTKSIRFGVHFTNIACKDVQVAFDSSVQIVYKTNSWDGYDIYVCLYTINSNNSGHYVALGVHDGAMFIFDSLDNSSNLYPLQSQRLTYIMDHVSIQNMFADTCGNFALLFITLYIKFGMFEASRVMQELANNVDQAAIFVQYFTMQARIGSEFSSKAWNDWCKLIAVLCGF